MRFLLLTFSLFIIRLIGFTQNVEFRSVTTYDLEMSNIWGYSDGEKEYAIAGTTGYFSIVDVTDPDNPVKLHQVDGPFGYWREMKTWGHYAYGVNDNGGNQGMAIMDLSKLPEELPVTFWKNDGTLNSNLKTSHDISIDEYGFVYLSGSNIGEGGVLILDLNQDPEQPTVVGQFNDFYVHDCYARNNILYTSDGYRRTFSIFDVSNKANLVKLGEAVTPGGYSHNNWLSDDSKTIFTTNENEGAFVTSFDISDFNDIKELDRYRSNPGSGVIPHNVFIRNDFAIISYYRDGVIILDVSEPDNMVEMGSYDTSPLQGGDFNGAWGAYPYLPSGNILVSDIEEGLFVLTPTYKRAVHIKGFVTDKNSHDPIFDASVSIDYNGNSTEINTNLSGKFNKGYQLGGTFTINVTKAGYLPFNQIFNLADGELLDLSIELELIPPAFTDTIYVVIPTFNFEEICDQNANNINANHFYICDGSSFSFYGSWFINSNNCLSYNANSASGSFVDTICFISENLATGAYNVNVAIISVGDITSSTTNIIENGKLSVLENPVQNHILLRNNIEVRAPMSFLLYDISGKMVSRIENNGESNLISIPTEHLSNGMYTLQVKYANEPIGFIKIIKN